jgi:hypothetical protein
MRHSIVTTTAEELGNFNISVWEVLMVVSRLEKLSSEVTDPSVKLGANIFYRRELGNSKNFIGKTDFVRRVVRVGEDGGSTSMGIPYVPQLAFSIPEGWNVVHSFGLLKTEVVKMGYAMTHGRLGASDGLSWPVREVEENVYLIGLELVPSGY